MRASGLGYSFAGALLIGSALLAACSPETPAIAAQDLCSKDGLMELVPQFRNANGRFQVPDPTKDLDQFLAAQQGLSQVIETILAKAQGAADPYGVANNRHAPLTFGAHWRAAEIGIQTDGSALSAVDPHFASYGGPSFLEGLKLIESSKGVFQAVATNEGIPALVYAMPTALPCVNRLVLAAQNSTGSWPQPSYALGPEAGGEAFLIVNICQDLGKVVRLEPASPPSFRPNAALIVAFQWADTDDMAPFRTDQKAHQHR